MELICNSPRNVIVFQSLILHTKNSPVFMLNMCAGASSAPPYEHIQGVYYKMLVVFTYRALFAYRVVVWRRGGMAFSRTSALWGSSEEHVRGGAAGVGPSLCLRAFLWIEHR